MKSARILRRRLLLALLLGLFSGCYSQAQPSAPQVCEVDIQQNQNQCTVTVKKPCKTDTTDPTTPVLDESAGDTVFWSPSGYTVSFKPFLGVLSHSPIGNSTVPSGSPAQPVTGDFWCNSLFRQCGYTYGLQQGALTCVDPGIRVVPPSLNLASYLWVVALVGFVSFVVLRIRLRKRDSPAK